MSLRDDALNLVSEWIADEEEAERLRKVNEAVAEAEALELLHEKIDAHLTKIFERPVEIMLMADFYKQGRWGLPHTPSNGIPAGYLVAVDGLHFVVRPVRRMAGGDYIDTFEVRLAARMPEIFNGKVGPLAWTAVSFDITSLTELGRCLYHAETNMVHVISPA